MSQNFFVDYWYYWLWAILGTFLPVEIASILIRKYFYGTRIWDWTLSDTVRRWAAAHHWVPAVVWGGFTLLMMHFFLQSNPS